MAGTNQRFKVAVTELDFVVGVWQLIVSTIFLVHRSFGPKKIREVQDTMQRWSKVGWFHTFGWLRVKTIHPDMHLTARLAPLIWLGWRACLPGRKQVGLPGVLHHSRVWNAKNAAQLSGLASHVGWSRGPAGSTLQTDLIEKPFLRREYIQERKLWSPKKTKKVLVHDSTIEHFKIPWNT